MLAIVDCGCVLRVTLCLHKQLLSAHTHSCIATWHIATYRRQVVRGATEGASPFVRNKAQKKDEQLSLFVFKTLCGQRDSNPHASRHQILSLTWLPITPCPQDLDPRKPPRCPMFFSLSAAKVKTFCNIHNIITLFRIFFSIFVS